MSKFVKLTVRSTGLPLVVNADLIESMIPIDGYTSIRMTGSVLGCTDHVLESVEQIEDQLLRDEFAMSALNGLLSDRKNTLTSREEFSVASYKIADAMLNERRKMTYDVYEEGWVANGGRAKAAFRAKIPANGSFLESCRIYFRDTEHYNPERNTIWGCRLFQTLEEAQKFVG